MYEYDIMRILDSISPEKEIFILQEFMKANTSQ